jgi:transcriptional regulator with XRE-family HTH domain
MRCQALLLARPCVSKRRGGSLCPTVSTPRSKMPTLTAFGALLAEFRDARQVSNGWAEIELSKGGAGTKIGSSTLSQYENGRVWAPDPVVLSELARLYRVSLTGLLAVLKANRQNPNLSADDALAVYKGAIDAESVAPGLLAEREHALQTVAREVNAIAEHLVGLAETAIAATKEVRSAGTRKADRGGTGRKPR